MTAMQFIPQEPAQNCTEEQIVDVPLSQPQEEIVEEQEPMCNDTVEQVVDVLALQVQETVEVNMAIPDGRMSESILEYIAVDPVRQIQEQSVDVVKINHTSETCAIARWSKLLTCPLHSRRRKGGSCAAPTTIALEERVDRGRAQSPDAGGNFEVTTGVLQERTSERNFVHITDVPFLNCSQECVSADRERERSKSHRCKTDQDHICSGCACWSRAQEVGGCTQEEQAQQCLLSLIEILENRAFSWEVADSFLRTHVPRWCIPSGVILEVLLWRRRRVFSSV